MGSALTILQCLINPVHSVASYKLIKLNNQVHINYSEMIEGAVLKLEMHFGFYKR